MREADSSDLGAVNLNEYDGAATPAASRGRSPRFWFFGSCALAKKEKSAGRFQIETEVLTYFNFPINKPKEQVGLRELAYFYKTEIGS